MIKKEIFVKAITAGGDAGEKHAEKLWAMSPGLGVCNQLDKLLANALKGDSPESDILYSINQLKAAYNVLKEEAELFEE